MVINITTKDITDEEVQLIESANNDFFLHGKTDVKCPRCGAKIVLVEYGSSYVIGCDKDCLCLTYRGI